LSLVENAFFSKTKYALNEIKFEVARHMKSQRLILTGCIIISIILFANGLYVLASFNKKSEHKYIKPGEKSSNYIENKSSIVCEQPVNLLLLGLDREEERSDVILLINYSPSEGKLNILSIPRDTMVLLSGKTVKINALISAGGESLIINRVERLIGLPVDYYITLNFAGFREIINILEGVEFDVPFNMNYDDPDQNLHIHLRKGRQILDGKSAEQLVRYRKGNREGEGYEDGDIGRVKLQQEFITALIRQKARLRYLSKVDDIFLVLSEHMATDIQLGDIKYYIKNLNSMDNIDINTFILPGESVYRNNTSYYLYDWKKTKEMIANNFSK
jgi:LCP family protein required for cell wall assembly